MAGRKLEETLEQLKSLRDVAPAENIDSVLRKALHDRSNLVVAEAAKLASAHSRHSLVPDLLDAMTRLFDSPVKTDPKCFGKTAIVKALTALDYSESKPFLRALVHVQMEPVWGGQEDSAIHLRSNAALALVQCTDIPRRTILRHLVNGLADKAGPVRMDAVRALEQMNGDEAGLILRLKALAGDAEPSVLGQVFDSLLRLEGEAAVTFLAPFLDRDNEEVRDEAALALGASRLPAAVALLMASWLPAKSADFRAVLLRALSSSREEEALVFLLNLVRNGLTRDAKQALEALELHKDSPEIAERLRLAREGRAAQ
jgi:HEAT repeat protein